MGETFRWEGPEYDKHTKYRAASEPWTWSVLGHVLVAMLWSSHSRTVPVVPGPTGYLAARLWITLLCLRVPTLWKLEIHNIPSYI